MKFKYNEPVTFHKKQSTALALSVAIHAAVIVSLAVFGGRSAHRITEAASYIFIKLQPPSAGEGLTRSFTPSPPLTPLPHSRLSGELARDSNTPPISSVGTEPDTSPHELSKPRLKRRDTTSSEELLSDPKTGKAFSRYFQSIRSRIQTVSARHRPSTAHEKGKVTVDFVLNRDGKLISCEPALTDDGNLDRLVVMRALDIIRESEPFLRFPPEVQADSISFNITLVFDG